MALIPIRLDLDNDGYKLRDTLLWNENDPTLSPEQFAEITCKDLGIPSTFKSSIVSSINDQILDYHSLPQTLFPNTTVLIRLDITINHTHLIDQFEWNLDKDNPDDMANIMVFELGLDHEFASAISHGIREQCFWIKRSLVNVGYSEETQGPIPEDLYGLVYPSLPAQTKRNPGDLDAFSARIIEMNEKELVSIESAGDRESRRIRKQHRSRRFQDSWSLLSPPRLIRTPNTCPDSKNDELEEGSCFQCKRTVALSNGVWFYNHLLCPTCVQNVSL